MKEQINRIFQKSGGRLSFDKNASPYQFEQEELEKFTELLIKECLDIVQAQKGRLTENMVYWNDHDYGYALAINDAVDMVKQHFGVEE